MRLPILPARLESLTFQQVARSGGSQKSQEVSKLSQSRTMYRDHSLVNPTALGPISRNGRSLMCPISKPNAGAEDTQKICTRLLLFEYARTDRMRLAIEGRTL